MVGINRTGINDNGISYNKSSVVFNPNGNKLLPDLIIDETDIYTVDANEVEKIRVVFPVRTDRKVDFYKSVL